MISVVVPVYNNEKYLNECFESLSQQTDQEFEIILIDDGSTDSSGKICDNFASKKQTCKVSHTENQGLLLARRLGMALASGDYILSLDSDDCLRPDTIEKLKAIIVKYNPDLICFDFSRGLKKTFSGTIIPSGLSKPGLLDIRQFDEVRVITCLGKFNNLANKVIKKEILDLNEDYSDYAGLMHGEDWLQTIIIVDRAKTVYYLNEPLYFYRESPKSSTYTFKKKQLNDLMKVFERLTCFSNIWGEKFQKFEHEGICMHCFWLLQGLSKLPNWRKKVYMVEEICDVMRLYCGHDLQATVKKLRIDFRLVLELALSKKPVFALILARLELAIYKAINMESR